jgi:hypothetical protein
MNFQSCPSEARSRLLVVDISNLLLCIAQLLPSICEKAEELIGLNLTNKSKILRDIHTKCQELLNCLILRGTSLDILQKVGFRSLIINVTYYSVIKINEKSRHRTIKTCIICNIWINHFNFRN